MSLMSSILPRPTLPKADQLAEYFELDNNPSRIDPLIEKFHKVISARWHKDYRDSAVSIALQEAISNAIYHGNLELSSKLREDGSNAFWELAEERRVTEPWSSRIVQVTLLLSDTIATFEVTDQGKGFKKEEVRSCFDGSGLHKLSGRGIAMMEALMDEVEFSMGGRRVVMKLHREGVEH